MNFQSTKINILKTDPRLSRTKDVRFRRESKGISFANRSQLGVDTLS